MSDKTFVWAVEYADEEDISINLYATETAAYEVAVQEAIEYMETMGCTSTTISGWVDAYNKVLSNRKTNPQLAIDLYNEWNHNQVSNELERYFIYVYDKEIIGFSTSNKKQVKVEDVPCKQCGRKVNDTEAQCWFCGCENPSKI